MDSLGSVGKLVSLRAPDLSGTDLQLAMEPFFFAVVPPRGRVTSTVRTVRPCKGEKD